MRRIILKLCLIISIFISFQGSCTKAEIESTTEKKKILKHNYILVNSNDNTPAQVEVSYSIFVVGNAENIVKTQILTTPFVIGGEDVMIAYDSISYHRKGKFQNYVATLKRNYHSRGADYLSIKNLSAVDLEYCVVGNQPLQFYSVDRVNSYGISNVNQIDKSNVLKESPTPIYKGTPVLYLLKPELAPQKEVYVPWAFGRCNGVSCSISDVQAKLISLKTPVFGEVTNNIPFSVSEIISLYQQEYNSGNTLFQDFQLYRRGQISSVNESIISSRLNDMKHYGRIPAGQALSNTGQVWFVNTQYGFYGNDNLIN
ncbi:hypothetical protein ACI76O_01900 [Capnocytophaga cynodegmi]|uniref:hypothetical protein n=1 Tax=Capnocytophaga cynodegmi TaxID=28189 RepID=UPI001AD56B33|nr:hypothetical protein [Capnocytophaga cynodegmi]GIM51343.1 hypothetical protein CAPN004_03730 [Capnocytophaga cynodegmi]